MVPKSIIDGSYVSLVNIVRLFRGYNTTYSSDKT